MTNKPGLYLHLPFCTAICPYCDFYVLPGDSRRRARFVDRLVAEIGLSAGSPWPRFVTDRTPQSFDTIYLGGGTPSLFEPEQLARILESVRESLHFEERPWIALEANPEDVTADRLLAWSELGVRFLSLGIQSFDPRGLEFLGRRHGPSEARRSLDLARTHGDATISVDLIYGLPGQTSEAWRSDLAAAVELGPHHLSCYQLTIERGTPFGFRKQRGELAELPDERQAELFRLTHSFLRDRGFAAYEVSNFAARPEHQSRHNLKYWKHTPYLGLGPSAHSFAGRHRWWNERKIKPWQARVEAGERPLADREILTTGQLCLERLMLGLRTPEGVDLEDFPNERGVAIRRLNRSLFDRLARRGLVEQSGFRLRPTLAGMAVADGIVRQVTLSPNRGPVC